MHSNIHVTPFSKDQLYQSPKQRKIVGRNAGKWTMNSDRPLRYNGQGNDDVATSANQREGRNNSNFSHPNGSRETTTNGPNEVNKVKRVKENIRRRIRKKMKDLAQLSQTIVSVDKTNNFDPESLSTTNYSSHKHFNKQCSFRLSTSVEPGKIPEKNKTNASGDTPFNGSCTEKFFIPPENQTNNSKSCRKSLAATFEGMSRQFGAIPKNSNRFEPYNRGGNRRNVGNTTDEFLDTFNATALGRKNDEGKFNSQPVLPQNLLNHCKEVPPYKNNIIRQNTTPKIDNLGFGEEEDHMPLLDESEQVDTEVMQLAEGIAISTKKGSEINGVSSKVVNLEFFEDNYQIPASREIRITLSSNENNSIYVKNQGDNVLQRSYMGALNRPRDSLNFAGKIFISKNFPRDRAFENFWEQDDLLHGYKFPDGLPRPIMSKERGPFVWRGKEWRNHLQVNTTTSVLIHALFILGFDYRNNRQRIPMEIIQLSDDGTEELCIDVEEEGIQLGKYITGVRFKSNFMTYIFMYFFPSLLAQWEPLGLLINCELFNASLGLVDDQSIRNQGQVTWQSVIHPALISTVINRVLNVAYKILDNFPTSVTFDSPQFNKAIGVTPISTLLGPNSELMVGLRVPNSIYPGLKKMLHTFSSSFKSTLNRNTGLESLSRAKQPHPRFSMVWTKERYLGKGIPMKSIIIREIERLRKERRGTSGRIPYRTIEEFLEIEEKETKQKVQAHASTHVKALDNLNAKSEFQNNQLAWVELSKQNGYETLTAEQKNTRIRELMAELESKAAPNCSISDQNMETNKTKTLGDLPEGISVIEEGSELGSRVTLERHNGCSPSEISSDQQGIGNNQGNNTSARKSSFNQFRADHPVSTSEMRQEALPADLPRPLDLMPRDTPNEDAGMESEEQCTESEQEPDSEAQSGSASLSSLACRLNEMQTSSEQWTPTRKSARIKNRKTPKPGSPGLKSIQEGPKCPRAKRAAPESTDDNVHTEKRSKLMGNPKEGRPERNVHTEVNPQIPDTITALDNSRAPNAHSEVTLTEAEALPSAEDLDDFLSTSESDPSILSTISSRDLEDVQKEIQSRANCLKASTPLKTRQSRTSKAKVLLVNEAEVEQFIRDKAVDKNGQDGSPGKADPFNNSMALPSEDVEQLLALLGEIRTVEEVCEDDGNLVIAKSYDLYKRNLAHAHKTRKSVSRFFNQVAQFVDTRRRSRSNWYIACFLAVNDTIKELKEICNRKDDDPFFPANQLDPTFDKLALKDILEKLKSIQKVKENARAVVEFHVVNPDLIFSMTPIPKSISVFNLVERSAVKARNRYGWKTKDISKGEDVTKIWAANFNLNFLKKNGIRCAFGRFDSEHNNFHLQQRFCLKVCPKRKEGAFSKRESSPAISDALIVETVRSKLIKDFHCPISLDNVNQINSSFLSGKISQEGLDWIESLGQNPKKSLTKLILSPVSNISHINLIRSDRESNKKGREVKKKEKLLEDIKKGKIPNCIYPENLISPSEFAKATVSNALFQKIDQALHHPARHLKKRRVVKEKPPHGCTHFESPFLPCIDNPSNSDIHKLNSYCKELNTFNKNNARKLNLININPGKAKSTGETLRLISSQSDETDLFMINEIRLEMDILLTSDLWPEGYTVYSHNENPLYSTAYTAIMTRNYSLSDRVIRHFSFGIFTGVHIRNELDQEVLIVSVYRPIAKQDDSCFYKKYHNNNQLIFVDWVREAIKTAGDLNLPLVIGGDWNLDFDGRPQDDCELVDQLKEILSGYTDICSTNTFFRGNSNSRIDHIFTKSIRFHNCRNLQWHKKLSLDGHSGQSFQFYFQVPKHRMKVVFNRKLDEPELIKKKALGKFDAIWDRIRLTEEAEEKVNLIFNETRKLLMSCSKPQARIVEDKLEFTYKQSKEQVSFINLKNICRNLLKSANDREKDELKRLLSKVGSVIAKIEVRDKKRTRQKLSLRATDDKNAVWDIFNKECKPNQVWDVDRTYTPNELADKVTKLQESTASDRWLNEPLNRNLPSDMMEFFPYCFNGENKHPSILHKFNNLKDSTKGWSGVNKTFLDALPLAFLRIFLLLPISTCLENGIYPESLKTSRITILPKKNKGIRPIAIGEVLTSVLEKVIKGSLNQFLECVGALPDAQAGFRSAMSCGTSLFEMSLSKLAFDGCGSWSNAKNSEPKVFGFLNSVLDTIYARDIDELMESANSELRLLEDVLTTLGIEQLLNNNNVGTLFRIMLVDLWVLAVKNCIPPCMIFTYLKISPAGAKKQFLSEICVKNDGLLPTVSDLRFKTKLLVPSGLIHTNLFSEDIGLPSSEAAIKFVHQLKSRCSWGELISYVAKFGNDKDSITEDEVEETLLSWVSQQEKDNVLLRNIADCMTKTLGGEINDSNSFALFSGPYSYANACAFDGLKKSAPFMADDVKVELVNAAGIPVNNSILNKCKARHGLRVNCPLIFHPLRMFHFKNDRELVGAATTIYNHLVRSLGNALATAQLNFKDAYLGSSAIENAAPSVMEFSLAKLTTNLLEASILTTQNSLNGTRDLVAKKFSLLLTEHCKEEVTIEKLEEAEMAEGISTCWATFLLNTLQIGTKGLNFLEVIANERNISLANLLHNCLGTFFWGKGSIGQRPTPGPRGIHLERNQDELQVNIYLALNHLTANGEEVENIISNLFDITPRMILKEFKLSKKRKRLSNDLLPPLSPVKTSKSLKFADEMDSLILAEPLARNTAEQAPIAGRNKIGSPRMGMSETTNSSPPGPSTQSLLKPDANNEEASESKNSVSAEDESAGLEDTPSSHDDSFLDEEEPTGGVTFHKESAESLRINLAALCAEDKEVPSSETLGNQPDPLDKN
ncbi:Oidioi.mRNA.OKI2018_I69.XSR.g14568.t1.cds [Oikopleura dioica]|uniref:Oidioi.mRNA.OKI2018_I69.XSR.g14568.t1.cds n=1 Tax=Oikopleura dioica TaxID=34765 RepID=A0ABN7SA94_OIKDI|nr:Oidioi.mRNA.OKI2018_I69.XSR.g14568.t1.cds [Oikopleura dioica]